MKPYERAYALMEEIYQNFSRVDKLWFLGEDTVMYSSLGRHLRNHASLWESDWEPVLVDGVDLADGVVRYYDIHYQLDYDTFTPVKTQLKIE